MTTDQLPIATAAPAHAFLPNLDPRISALCATCGGDADGHATPEPTPWLDLHTVRDVEANPVLERIALAADRFPVLADCGCAEDFGQVVHMICELRLCGDHAATHTCHPCDVHAFAYRSDED